MTTQAKGEYRVGISFNPSANGLVDEIKRKAAELIDLIDSVDTGAVIGVSMDNAQISRAHEVGRLKALAQTAVEDAAMWAV